MRWPLDRYPFGAVTRRCRRGCSEEKKVQNEGPQPHGWGVEVGRAIAQYVPEVQFGEGSPHRVQDVRLVQEPRCHRSLSACSLVVVTVEQF